MRPACSKAYLRRMRNEIPIRDVIAGILQIPWKIREGRFRFLCPLCREFDTATNPDTNLARCFRCKQNFNPIDITMVERRYDFLAAVSFLDAYLPDQQSTTHATDSNSAAVGG
jgi:hypothetical protein